MLITCHLEIISNLLSVFDVEALIRNGGLLIIFLAVYGSTGLFFCFFIPTGAVLFTAGILAASGGLHYNIFTICTLMILASVLGNITGYLFGWKTGTLLYSRKDSTLFKKRHITTAETFYKKYGWLALSLGMNFPIIRTFASIVAGMIKLDFRKFILLIIAGSIIWILAFILAGYFIGTNPVLKPLLKYIVGGFIILVTVPMIIWLTKELRRMRRANKEKAK